MKRRPGFILQQEDLLWITVKSSDVHQQLNQSKSTTFFHFFSSFLCFFWKIFLFRTAVNLIFSTVPYELEQLYLNFSNVTTKDKYFPYFFLQSCKYCNFNTKKTVPRSRHSCTSSIKGLVNCMSHCRRDGAVIMSDWSDQSLLCHGRQTFSICLQSQKKKGKKSLFS